MKRTITLTLCALLLVALAITASAEKTVVSEGEKYTLVTPASEAYPDDGIKLTDGIYGTHVDGTDGYYASGAYVGFNKEQVNDNGTFTIIVDLGEKRENLTEFTVGYLSETIVGISAPMSVTFAIADERNNQYSEIGTVETTPENSDVSATYAKTVKADKVSGRYVLVTIKPMGYTDKDGITSIAPWTFIDEISVRAGSEDGGDNSNPPENSEVTPETSSPDDGDSGIIATPDESTPDDSKPDDKPNESKPDPDEEKTPQAGDELMIFAFVLLALASLAMAVVLFKTKKHSEF